MTFMKLNNRPAGKSIDNLFNEILGSFPAFVNNDESFFAPAANVHETKDAYHIELNAPGRTKEDFNITLEKGTLTVGYEQKEENKQEDYKTLRREFSFKSFKRSFHVDESINTENIQAKYENGVLKLLLPKKEEVKPNNKQISIQ
jgi:HSP20 family protein